MVVLSSGVNFAINSPTHMFANFVVGQWISNTVNLIYSHFGIQQPDFELYLRVWRADLSELIILSILIFLLSYVDYRKKSWFPISFLLSQPFLSLLYDVRVRGASELQFVDAIEYGIDLSILSSVLLAARHLSPKPNSRIYTVLEKGDNCIQKSRVLKGSLIASYVLVAIWGWIEFDSWTNVVP
jgi:hypothetical protein